MPVTGAFTATKVALDRSMSQIGKLLEDRGVRQHRYTHLRPDDPDAVGGPEGIGQIAVEFAWQQNGRQPIGVRVVVAYQPWAMRRRSKYGQPEKARGTTPEMAARALFWSLKSKFDAIDYGIEEFEVAFMPHMLTAGGYTFAERPQLVLERMQLADADMRLALPAPDDEEVGR